MSNFYKSSPRTCRPLTFIRIYYIYSIKMIRIPGNFRIYMQIHWIACKVHGYGPEVIITLNRRYLNTRPGQCQHQCHLSLTAIHYQDLSLVGTAVNHTAATANRRQDAPATSLNIQSFIYIPCTYPPYTRCCISERIRTPGTPQHAPKGQWHIPAIPLTAYKETECQWRQQICHQHYREHAYNRDSSK